MEQVVVEEADDTAVLEKLKIARDDIAAIVASSAELNKGLVVVNGQLSLSLETCVAASDAIAPLQSQSIAAKALHSRINRAVSPALSVLHSFSLVETLQRRLLYLSSKPVSDKPNQSQLLRYVDCVDQLNSAIGTVVEGCEPAIMKLQEAVEFLNRTKATDQLRIHRLRETLAAIKALYEKEVDAMKYEGVLDEALLRLQDDYEGLLQQIKHEEIGDFLEFDGWEDENLGADRDVEVLRRISETLASNDCLDICIDIYVKVRYRRAAKALMRLKPTYLKTYAPEDLDTMEWETLESAITLWIEHFQLAVKVVFIGEKNLSFRVLSGIMDGAVWPECFAKIADKIMAVFFRFGEGVARSSKEPQKLFKLLDMYDSMDRIRAEFMLVFDGESGIDICTRFRELQKLLVDTTSKVFWEFGLQIEGLQDAAPPPADGSVPNVVRYAVNYLKCLAASGYGATMEQVLRTEQMWKSGRLLSDQSLLEEAVSNALDALQRNVETKRTRYKDKVVAHILAMNTYWYMYMRTKGSELAKLVGEANMKKKYKMAAEEAAYNYQAQAWGPLVKLLSESGEIMTPSRMRGAEISARGKMDAFIREFEEMLRRHRSSYCVPDADLREQIKDAVAKLVVPAYAGFLHAYSGVKLGRLFPQPDAIREFLRRLFERDGTTGGGQRRRSEVEDGNTNFTRPTLPYKTRNFRRREYGDRVEDEYEEEEGGSEEGVVEESGRRGIGEGNKSSFKLQLRRFDSQVEDGEESEGTIDTLRGGDGGRRIRMEGEKSSFGRRVFKSRVEDEGERVNERRGRFRGEEGRRQMVVGKKVTYERKKYDGEDEESIESEYTERGKIERRASMGSRQSGFEDDEGEESDGRSVRVREEDGGRRPAIEGGQTNFGRRRFKNRFEDEEEKVSEKRDGRVRKEGVRRDIEEDKVGSFGKNERYSSIERMEKRTTAESEKRSFGRREFKSRMDDIERIDDSEDKAKGKESYVRRREFRSQLEGGEEGSVGRRVVTERENPRFGRRELKIQIEKEGGGNVERKGAGSRTMMEDERTNFRRRAFKTSVED